MDVPMYMYIKQNPRTGCEQRVLLHVEHIGDTSDESVLDEEWKPSKNTRKNSKQRKACSAKIRCKSLSPSIKTGSTFA
jgi:hypothetical protein